MLPPDELTPSMDTSLAPLLICFFHLELVIGSLEVAFASRITSEGTQIIFFSFELNNTLCPVAGEVYP